MSAVVKQMTSYNALRSKAAALDLSARGKIRVTGEDRARLLHAMSTNHVQGLKSMEGLYALFLTAQGRIIADANIYNLDDSLFLDTEPELAQTVFQHLDRFIIADDAEVQDETPFWAAIGIEGPAILEYASALAIPLPPAELSIAKWNSGFVARASSTGLPGIRLFVPVHDFTALSNILREAGIPEASPDDAHVVRLENGLPRYGEDFGERHLVQETGLMHGVHPNKGCYVGQEIVERVRSRAQLHRQLRQLRISAKEAPEPGTKLLAESKEVGEITSAAFSPALDCVVALGYIRTEGLAAAHPQFKIAGFDPRIVARLA